MSLDSLHLMDMRKAAACGYWSALASTLGMALVFSVHVLPVSLCLLYHILIVKVFLLGIPLPQLPLRVHTRTSAFQNMFWECALQKSCSLRLLPGRKLRWLGQHPLTATTKQ